MAGRRILYAALLIGAGVLHVAYGQYVTHYMLLFLLLLPIFSLLISLPAILGSRVSLSGGGEVVRGRGCGVMLEAACGSVFAPAGWKICTETQNLFIDVKSEREKLVFRGVDRKECSFPMDTSRLGVVRCRIRYARVCDYLGLFAVPVRHDNHIDVTVMPNTETPFPEPDLVQASGSVLKPMPMGFSEEHELRPYRDGDAINLIHRKLSLKLDEPILREPQFVLRKSIMIAAEMPGDYAGIQSVLEQIRFLAEKLLDNGIEFTLIYGLRSERITTEDDLMRFFRRELFIPIHAEGLAPLRTGDDTLVYRVMPGRGHRK